MRCLGNDVIDLGERPTVTPRHRERFIQRVLSQSERALLSAQGSSDRLLLSLFAAKEAAFKVVCKLGPTPVFAHRKFVVADDLKSVTYAQWKLALSIASEPEWIHAVAATFTPVPAGVIDRIRPNESEGAAARRLLLTSVQQTLGHPAERLQVRREPDPSRWDGLGAPQLLLDGQPLPIDSSLSHDGAFAASVFTEA